MNRFIRPAAVAFALAYAEASALACGCFTPPDPSVPVVQAGERIVFSADGGQITAHIQIQYSGDAKDFGWLLPLPSVPTMKLGSDELFSQITSLTQPKYRLVATNSCGNKSFGGVVPATAGAAEDGTTNGATGSPVVVQDSIGPYDYAVLKADSKDAMLGWLADNRYFVPAGTDSVVGAYVHPGAYFLALKLKSGKSTGDLQPVVVQYASDLPMIPIVLTSTAAQPDMGIQVWTLGKGRAIPRNYFHTVIDDAVIDWPNAGKNYNDVIIRATKEAKDRHTFVTEYAGSSSVMQGVLDPPGRFGTQLELSGIADPVQFVDYLNQHQFGVPSTSGFGGGPVGVGFGGRVFSGALLAILEANIPFPPALASMGVTAAQYYSNLDYWLGTYRTQNPSAFAGLSFTIDPVAMSKDIWNRVVQPTLDAAALFSAPYLTRLYTTLSPANMTEDPVFSFNPDLPGVSNIHEAKLTYDCGLTGGISGSHIVTEQGFRLHVDGSGSVPPSTTAPASLRIEVLRESGAPVVQTDNTSAVQAVTDGSGCSLGGGVAGRSAGSLAVVALALLLSRRRARRS